MSKKRRSILDADASEIENAGKQIMNSSTSVSPQPELKEEPPVTPIRQVRKVAEPIEKRIQEEKPVKKTKRSTKKADVAVKSKNKMIYLDEAVHREARIKASIAGKTIKRFITDLIAAHKSQI